MTISSSGISILEKHSSCGIAAIDVWLFKWTVARVESLEFFTLTSTPIVVSLVVILVVALLWVVIIFWLGEDGGREDDRTDFVGLSEKYSSVEDVGDDFLGVVIVIFTISWPSWL